MKHIIQQYGTECSLLELSYAEYHALRAFLEPSGVELRLTCYHGDTDTCVIQARSALLDNCRSFGDRSSSWSLERSQKDILEGRWRL